MTITDLMSLGYLIMYIFNVMIELIEGYFNKIILSKFFSGRWNYVSAGAGVAQSQTGASSGLQSQI